MTSCKTLKPDTLNPRQGGREEERVQLRKGSWETCTVWWRLLGHSPGLPLSRSASPQPLHLRRPTASVTPPNPLAKVSVSTSTLWVSLNPGPLTSFQILFLMLKRGQGGAGLPLDGRPFHAVRMRTSLLWTLSGSSAQVFVVAFPKANESQGTRFYCFNEPYWSSGFSEVKPIFRDLCAHERGIHSWD